MASTKTVYGENRGKSIFYESRRCEGKLLGHNWEVLTVGTLVLLAPKVPTNVGGGTVGNRRDGPTLRIGGRKRKTESHNSEKQEIKEKTRVSVPVTAGNSWETGVLKKNQGKKKRAM